MGGALSAVEARVASPADVAAITRTLTAAFRDDPVWGWAFTDPDAMATWWHAYAAGAVRYPWVFKLPGCEAVAIWIPPGGTEMEPADQTRMEGLLPTLAGDRAEAIRAGLRRFDEAYPHDGPHYYLTLLGTHPDYRGRGLGMALLEETLARIDAQHAPAYLESTNPVNDARYARVGFRPRGRFEFFDGGPVVTTMWRDVR